LVAFLLPAFVLMTMSQLYHYIFTNHAIRITTFVKLKFVKIILLVSTFVIAPYVITTFTIATFVLAAFAITQFID